MPDVFISYSSEDKQRTEQLVAELEKNGISCWLDRNNIATGSYFAEEVPEAILDCPIFMLLLSENSQRSKYVLMELDWATSHDKDIIPVVISDCAIVPKFGFLLQNKQRYHAFDGSALIIHKMISQIKALLSKDRSRSGDHSTVELAQRHGIKCPACGASDYIEGEDYLKAAVTSEKARANSRFLSLMLVILITVLLVFSLLFHYMAGQSADVIQKAEIKMMECKDDIVIVNRIKGVQISVDIFKTIFSQSGYIFATFGLLLSPVFILFTFPDYFYKLRNNRRKQKHIEVCKLKCCVCEKQFKNVIKLDHYASADA